MQPPSTTSSAGPSSVRVELGPRSYSAEVGPGVLAAIGGRVRDSLGNRCRKALLVIDQAVPGKFADRAESSLRESGLEVARATLHASEHEKSLHSFGALLQQLAGLRLERRDVLVALGGGVIGDLAGFAAASYRRGIPFVQCPTTLLSMVDASVGGKTAINIDLGPGSGLVKNMAGAFHQPIAVLADTLTLESLEPRQYRCGMAECIKHAMIGADFQDPSLLDWTRRHASSPAQSAEISELITRNVAIKARVVAGDEREEREGAGPLTLAIDLEDNTDAAPACRARFSMEKPSRWASAPRSPRPCASAPPRRSTELSSTLCSIHSRSPRGQAAFPKPARSLIACGTTKRTWRAACD